MISTEYGADQCKQMLQILGKNKAQISAYGLWPDFVSQQFGKNAEFFYNINGQLFVRNVQNTVISWKGPLLIDQFWQRKISQSLSFQCAKYVKSLQSKVSIKEIGHLLCKFYKFVYIPSNLII